MSSPPSKTEKPFLFYTFGTPNGRKVSVLLEELKAAYGLDYDVERILLPQGIQYEPWFVKLNPNSKIPVLVDRARNGFAVFESAAIMLYLEQNYDKEFRFTFDSARQPDDYSEMLQWLFWAHGGLGPMQAQAVHFKHFATEEVPYAKKRYHDEIERLYGVLNIRLADRDYLAGPGRGSYTIADMNAYSSIAGHQFVGIDTLDTWPNLKRWSEGIAERAEVKAGSAVPVVPA